MMNIPTGKYIVKHNDRTHIYGMIPGKLYPLIGYDDDCHIIKNESDELIRVHFSRATEIYIGERDDNLNELFDFGEALKRLKEGKPVTRKGWNGKGMFVVMQKGYPDGIPSNKQTAEAWGMKEGDPFKVEPYLQIITANKSHAMWVPSIGDLFAEDWEQVYQ